jgi:hypothetical protein
MTGGDQHPPLFYVLHGAFLHTFGESALALRAPAILGFWLMSIALYAFASHRTSPAYGLVAMCLPLITEAQSFAYDARGYALSLGFGALALLCWQRAAGGRARPIALVGLACSLAAAVGSHYYSILLLAPIAIAEAVRSNRTRRFDVAYGSRYWRQYCRCSQYFQCSETQARSVPRSGLSRLGLICLGTTESCLAWQLRAC